MPGVLHESIILLFARAPELVVELFGEALGLDPRARVVPCDPVTHEPVPTERRADSVFETRALDGPRAVVLEVQLRRDRRKAAVWPYYAAGARLRHRCPAALAVLALKPAVAAWAARPIATGQPDSDFKPVVVGPSGVPWVTEPDPKRPERIVLSAIVHGDQPGGERVLAALAATLRMLDDERRSLYYSIVWDCSSDVVRRTVEKLMNVQALFERTTKAREMLAKGKAMGEEIGEARGLTTGLFAVLAARGLPVSKSQRAKVLRCEDPAVLRRWMTRAGTAASTADALD
jgi:hypothetical protein